MSQLRAGLAVRRTESVVLATLETPSGQTDTHTHTAGHSARQRVKDITSKSSKV